MAWTGGTSGPWDKTTANREGVLFGNQGTSLFSIQLDLVLPAHNVKAVLLNSQDLRSGFACGIEGANVVIQQVNFGVVTSTLATAAHGLAAEPYVMEVRYIDGKISVRFNSSETDVVEYDNTTDLFAGNSYIGFVSATANARVLRAKVCKLAPQSIPRADVVGAIGGNELWASLDGISIARIGRVLFDLSAQITCVEFEQKLYAWGGGRAIVYDPSDGTIVDYVPTAGKLPGQVQGIEDRPGRTTATVGESHMSRVLFSGDALDPQNLYTSAINDPLDLNTGSVLPGRAYALSASKSGKIGQPVRALYSLGSALFIGCDRSMWIMVGDPALNNAVIEVIDKGVGVSGKDSVTARGDNSLLVHSPIGLFSIAGQAVSISDPVLSEYISMSEEELALMQIIVMRDPSRGGVHIFRTTRATADEANPSSIHLWYDDRVATEAGGGFFVDIFPNSMGPTAACQYKGKAIWGTRNGYICALDDARSSDFDPDQANNKAAINSYMAMQLLAGSALDRDVVIEQLAITMGNSTTGAKLKIYGAHTAEDVYEAAGRVTLLNSTSIAAGYKKIDRRLRSHAIVIEISNAEIDKTWSLEKVHIGAFEAQRLNVARKVAIAAPGAPCGPPVSGTGTGTGTGSGSLGSGPGAGGTGFTGTGTGTGTGSGRTTTSGSAFPGDGSAGGVTEF